MEPPFCPYYIAGVEPLIVKDVLIHHFPLF